MSAEDKKALESAIEKLRYQKENFGFMERFTVDENWVALQALEKQIPTKPQEINEERIRLDSIWDWSCGKCGRFHRNDYPLNYCNECGQKVDWSDWVEES